MGQISLQIPVAGSPNSSEDPKVASSLSTIQTWANGNVDGTNLSAAAAQSVGANQGGQTVKGAVNIAASESRTNTAYGTLTTPDQVTGIVLPANGLIRVWYQATWQESVQGAAKAAIFVGANQVKLGAPNTGAPVPEEASIGGGVSAATPQPLASASDGLHSTNSFATGSPTSYPGDVTTGQIVGGGWVAGPTGTVQIYTGGSVEIFAAAGTYTISVQFKASSGSVTADHRKLWVEALSFS